MLSIISPTGVTVSARCGVLRCRAIGDGWYDGAAAFVREQMDLTAGEGASWR